MARKVYGVSPYDTDAQRPSQLPDHGVPAAWLGASCGTALEGLALVVMAGVSVYSALTDTASQTTRAVTEAVMLLVLAVGVLLLAVNLLRRRRLARTPTLLWNGMLVPVGFSLMTGGAGALGVTTLIVAVATFVAALAVPSYRPEDDEPAT